MCLAILQGVLMAKLTVQPSEVHYMCHVNHKDDSYSNIATINMNSGGLM